MKDQFEAKQMLLTLPALVLWEIVYQLVICRLFSLEGDTMVHGVGFVLVVGLAWILYRRYAEKEEEEDEEA